MEEVKHYQVNGKYRIIIERAASTKGILGYKIETNDDNLDLALINIQTLKEKVEEIATEGV